MAPGYGPKFRHNLGRFRETLQPIVACHESIRLALERLDQAVQESFPAGPSAKQRAGRPHVSPNFRLKRAQNKINYLRNKNKTLERKLDALRVGKQGDQQNRMTPEFLAKVALSMPTTCARGFHSAWTDLVGTGVANCGRTTIAKIRDAFVEEVKRANVLQVALAATRSLERRAAAFAPIATAAAAPVFVFPCVTMLHIHDEASLRLRSSADTDLGAPARSRSSKVQQHSVSVMFPEQALLRWHTELDPLSNKTAKVLATALNKVLRAVSSAIGESWRASSANVERGWFVHVLVGDGVTTNEAAAKVLLAWVRKESLKFGLRYFLIVVKCSSHQTNLTLASAVSGSCALTGAAYCPSLSGVQLARRQAANRSDAAHRTVCGAVVRFFKFLVSDYYTDFCANLQDIVGKLAIGEPSAVRDEQRAKSAALRQLYGDGVFPPGLLECLDGGLNDWSHCLTARRAPGPGAAATAPAIRTLAEAKAVLLEILRKRILVVDEHPTLTRMFTFTPHIECFLLLSFLGCVGKLVKLRG